MVMDINNQENFWLNRRVVITGHTGFKGSWLTLWLMMQGADVWGYSLPVDNINNILFSNLNLFNLSSPDQLGKLHHFEGNINDLSQLRTFFSKSKPEVVFHLAAQPLVRQSYLDPLGTWQTNVLGTLNILESAKSLTNICVLVMITTDKVYKNREWMFGYRENDELGGNDPYSASKAAMELAIASWKNSFLGVKSHQVHHLSIATARSGNVIGGGDWAENRIVPDTVRALKSNQLIEVRNPYSTRPWQHVLDPLHGYQLLAEKLFKLKLHSSETPFEFPDSFNFGPSISSNQTVKKLVQTILKSWPGEWYEKSNKEEFHEAGLLHLESQLARNYLAWRPRWCFEETVEKTIFWYKSVSEGQSALQCTMNDIIQYQKV